MYLISTQALVFLFFYHRIKNVRFLTPFSIQFKYNIKNPSPRCSCIVEYELLFHLHFLSLLLSILTEFIQKQPIQCRVNILSLPFSHALKLLCSFSSLILVLELSIFIPSLAELFKGWIMYNYKNILQIRPS